MGISRLKAATRALYLYMVITLCGVGMTHKTNAQTTTESPTYHGARLVEKDSIMIDLIGRFVVYDYQPESGLFLGGELGQPAGIMPKSFKATGTLGLVIFNRKGEVLHKIDQANEGPTGYGSGAYLHTFIGPDKIGVLGTKAFYQYKIDGTFLGKASAINAIGWPGLLDEVRAASTDGKHLAMGLISPQEGFTPTSESKFQNANSWSFFDLAEENKPGRPALTDRSDVKGAGYPDHPIYAQGSKYAHGLIPPLMVANANKGLLYTIHPELPKLFTYSLTTGQATSTIDLKPSFFETGTEAGDFSGAAGLRKQMMWEMKGGAMANSRYHDMIQLGDYTLLRYSAALPKEISNRLQGGKGYRSDPDWTSIRKKHYKHYYQLLKDGQKVVSDFELPILEPQPGSWQFKSNSSLNGIIIGGNGLDEIYVFELNSGKVERDYELIRVYKLELLDD